MKNKFFKNIIVNKRLILILMVFIINLYLMIMFYSYGGTNIFCTIAFYLLMILLAFQFIKNKKIAFNIIAILNILFIAEIYLRVSRKGNLNYTEANSNSIFANYNSQIFGENRKYFLGYRVNQPNSTSDYSSIDFSYKHRYNELGLREQALSIFKNTKNILLLGDSFTEGAGAPEDSTLSKSLAFHLGQNIQCINAGVRGSDPVYEYQLLDTLFQLTNPKMVICNISYSDIPDIMNRGGDERFTQGFRKQFWWEYFYGISFLFRKIMLDVFEYRPFQIQFEDLTYSVDVIMKKIIAFEQYCNSKGVPFLCIITPNLNELINLESFNFQDSFIELNKHTGIRFINTQIGFTNYLNNHKMSPDKIYHLTDFHLNSKGYWLQGAIVADFIKGGMKMQ
ncbi:MAG: hypothetical protein R2760_08995 [Chitinophagales bacterium]